MTLNLSITRIKCETVEQHVTYRSSKKSNLQKDLNNILAYGKPFQLNFIQQ